MLIDVDMVFFLDNYVIDLETNVQPCQVSNCSTYSPRQLVDGVIELEAGELPRRRRARLSSYSFGYRENYLSFSNPPSGHLNYDC